MNDDDDFELMTPEQVRQLAARVERGGAPSGYGGVIGMVPEIDDSAGVLLPPEQHAPARLKVYCESCGHVDSHAPGCPELRRQAAEVELEALDREEAIAERQSEPEPILPLVRRIGASLLRRFAKRLEGQ